MDNATLRLGLTSSELFDLCWCDYERLCYKVILDDQYKWQHTREILAMLYNVNRGAKTTAKKGSQIIPLPIDNIKHEEKKPLTIEQHNEAVKKLGKYFKK